MNSEEIFGLDLPSLGHVISQQSNKLSRKLDDAQRRLNQLPDKFEQTLIADDKSHGIRFGRGGRSTWGLFFAELEKDGLGDVQKDMYNLPVYSWKPVSDCSLQQKILAAQLLPKLLLQFNSKRTEQVRLLKGALSEVERAMNILDSIIEGKGA